MFCRPTIRIHDNVGGVFRGVYTWSIDGGAHRRRANLHDGYLFRGHLEERPGNGRRFLEGNQELCS